MINNLDEAIQHCKEKAEENRKKADEWYAGGCSFAQAEGNEYLECAKEHEQLAEWLTELKAFREWQSIMKTVYADDSVLVMVREEDDENDDM